MKASKKILPREEWPYEVPGNWVWTRLEHILESVKEKTDSFNANLKYVGLENIEKDTGTIDFQFADEVKSTKTVFKQGNILYGRLRPYLNKHGLVPFDGICSTDILVFNSKEISLNQFVDYYFHLPVFIEYSVANSKGINLPRVTERTVFEAKFPLPPLPEQQRIVARIESLFAKLDAAAEKIRAALDQFPIRKAAILHKAFTGELTKKWRKENGVGMESWKRKKFEELGETRLGKMLDKEKNQGKATKYLRNVNVRWFSFSFDDMLSILVTEDEREKLSIEDGDLLICEGGEPGRCAVWTHGKNNYVYQKALHRFRPYSEHSSQFMAYYLHYLSINGKLEMHFTGTTIKHLTGKALALLPCPAPVYSEQKEIVRILDNIFAREQAAKEAAERLLEQIALTKKSILARAFRGKLGTNDPTEESAERWLSQENTVSLQAY